MADMKKKSLSIPNLMSPVGTANFADVFEARAFEDGPLKYGIVIAVKKDSPAMKSTAMLELKKAVAAVAADKFGKAPVRNPLRDGDEAGANESFKGCIYFRASAFAEDPQGNPLKAPPVFDESGKTLLTTDDDFYSGCQARIKVDVWSYDKMGNKGVGLSLRATQRTSTGDRIDGRTSVTEMPEAEGYAVDPMD
jgi:hypothetical protein